MALSILFAVSACEDNNEICQNEINDNTENTATLFAGKKVTMVIESEKLRNGGSGVFCLLLLLERKSKFWTIIGHFVIRCIMKSHKGV